MNKLISIIVPVYNVETFLGECVESLIHQTYQNVEIILVDDGSTDRSGELCEQYALKDSRIQVIHKANGGLSDARNVGMEIAKGAYYSFVDSDDYLEQDAIQSLYDAIRESNADLAICNMMRFYEDGSTGIFYQPSTEMQVLDETKKFETLKQPSVCNKLFYAGLFQNVRFPKGKYYEDTFVYHELLYNAKGVVLTGKTGYWYRLRKSSILGGEKYTDKYFDSIEAVWYRCDFLLKHKVHPYAEEACLSLYAELSNAEKFIRKTEANKEKFKSARAQYQMAYKHLMSREANTGVKQKLRLFLLKYFPQVHAKIY